MSYNKITSTDEKQPIYSYKEENWKHCPFCKTKLFKIVKEEGSVIEVKCKCGKISEVTI